MQQTHPPATAAKHRLSERKGGRGGGGGDTPGAEAFKHDRAPVLREGYFCREGGGCVGKNLKGGVHTLKRRRNKGGDCLGYTY